MTWSYRACEARATVDDQVGCCDLSRAGAHAAGRSKIIAGDPGGSPGLRPLSALLSNDAIAFSRTTRSRLSCGRYESSFFRRRTDSAAVSLGRRRGSPFPSTGTSNAHPSATSRCASCCERSMTSPTAQPDKSMPLMCSANLRVSRIRMPAFQRPGDEPASPKNCLASLQLSNGVYRLPTGSVQKLPRNACGTRTRATPMPQPSYR